VISGGHAANDHVTQLLEQLRSSSALARAEAAQSLASQQDPRVGPALTQALRDPDRFVRWRAADALATQRYAAAAAELKRIADTDPDATARQKAGAALSTIKSTQEYKVYVLRSSHDATERWGAAFDLRGGLPNPEVERGLVAALSDSDPKVRAEASKSLGSRGVREAVPALVDLLRASARNEHQVAVAAAEALGKLGDARAVDALVSVLRGDRNVAGAAVKALAELKDPRSVPGLIEFQRHDLQLHSYDVALALKAIGQGGLDSLVAALEASPPLPAEERRAIAHAISYVDDPRIEDGALRLLSDSDSTVRGHILLALGRMKSKKAVEAILRFVDDPDREVSRAAVRALGNIGDRRATPSLVRVLADPARMSLHDDAVGALAAIGDPAASEALAARLDATRGPIWSVHLRAAEALCSTGGQRARQALLAALRAGDSVAARGAFRCLISYGEPDTAPRIAAALNDAPSHDDNFARACLMSGNAELKSAAEAWARKHGKTLSTWGPAPVRWGESSR
jgi:HEAT repeat protein